MLVNEHGLRFAQTGFRPVLLDIDRTVHSTDAVRSSVKNRITRRFGIEPEVYDRAATTYDATLAHRSDFHPHGLLEVMSLHFGVPTRDLARIYFHPTTYKHGLYPDVLPAVAQIAQRFSVGIFSEGFAEMQRKKVSPLRPHLDPDLEFIFLRKLTPEALAALPVRAVIIDDKVDVIDKLLKERPDIYPMWLNRTTTEVHSVATTVSNLADVARVLTNGCINWRGR